MKLTVANANITNALSTASISLANNNIVNSISLGNVSITPSQITVGSATITPTAVSVPTLVLGGSQFSGGLQGGIINYQEFTANGTWYNPYANASVNTALTGSEQVFVMAWGGGGGGAANGFTKYGAGGGGACVFGTAVLSSFQNTCSVTVGGGGASISGATGSASNGGNSIFVINATSSIVAYGGGGGNSAADRSGGGGGWFGSQINNDGASPLGGVAGAVSTFGGGGGGNTSTTVGGDSIFGGGGGSLGSTGYKGGNSIFGASGGGNVISYSVFGGIGGIPGISPTTPGGGAGAVPTTPQNGARGEVRVWVFGPAGTTAGAPTYTLTANTTTLYEGSSVLYTVSTTNVANGTSLYYTLNNSSTAVATDFTTAVNGSVTINGGTGTFTLSANNDTDSANEAFQIDVRTGSTTGSIVASNGSVSIVPALPTVSYITSTSVDGLSTNTYTFNNISIGTPNASRLLVIGAVIYNGTVGSNPNIISVKVDNVDATISVRNGFTSPSSNVSAIAYITKTSETTANIQINATTDTFNTAGVGIWTITDLQSTTPISTNTAFGQGNLTRTVNVVSNSITIATHLTFNGTTTDWTNLTERYDYDTRSGEFFSGADTTHTSNNSTYSVTSSGGTANSSLLVASWR